MKTRQAIYGIGSFCALLSGTLLMYLLLFKAPNDLPSKNYHILFGMASMLIVFGIFFFLIALPSKRKASIS